MRRFTIPIIVLTWLFATASGTPAREQHASDIHLDGLAGTFVEPAGTAPYKGVLMIAGSGPTDRNGNSKLGVSADYLEQLADALAASGSASLRYDKRGVGGSKALVTSEAALRFSDFVGDAERWAAWLGQQPGIVCVFLLGHSEGGLIATLVAGKSSPAGLALVSSPGGSLGTVLARQLQHLPMTGALRADALTTLKQIETGRTVANVDPKLHNLFRPSVQPFLISLINIDPAAELAKLSLPTLIVSGGKDMQVAKSDYDALTTARPDAEAVRVPDMNHVLKDISGGRDANLAAYKNPNLPLAPELAGAVTEFITSTPCPR